MAEKKTFQIVMNTGAHRRLKKRAKGMGIPIGLFVENLLSSLELRLEKQFKLIESGGFDFSDAIANQITLSIWRADQEGWAPESVKDATMKIRNDLIKDEAEENDWTPQISISLGHGILTGAEVENLKASKKK